MKVSSILKSKGGNVIATHPNEPVRTLVARLKLAQVGALVVTEADGRMVGIVSERDVVHALAEHDARVMDMTVSELMTKHVVTCKAEDSVAEIARVMTRNRIRHLPVMEGGSIVGMVSVGDVVKNRLDEMSMEADVLRDIAIRRG